MLVGQNSCNATVSLGESMAPLLCEWALALRAWLMLGHEVNANICSDSCVAQESSAPVAGWVILGVSSISLENTDKMKTLKMMLIRLIIFPIDQTVENNRTWRVDFCSPLDKHFTSWPHFLVLGDGV